MAPVPWFQVKVREVGSQALGHAIDEAFLLRVATEIGKWRGVAGPPCPTRKDVARVSNSLTVF